MSTTLDRLLAQLPDGPLSRDEDALHVLVEGAWAEQVDDLETAAATSVDALLLDAPDLLDRWESVYDLHPAATATESERAAAVLEAIRRVPLLTGDYIAAQVAVFSGVTPTIIEFCAFHCDDPASVTDDLGVDQQWNFWAAFDRALGVAAGMDPTLAREQARLEALEPGHAFGTACYDEFLPDDPYSLTDRDLLGA